MTRATRVISLRMMVTMKSARGWHVLFPDHPTFAHRQACVAGCRILKTSKGARRATTIIRLWLLSVFQKLRALRNHQPQRLLRTMGMSR
jgi:hypothetical protein